MEEAKATFTRTHETAYGYGETIEVIRRKEFKRLNECAYLDHAGATQYARSQVAAHASDLESHAYGNPHSRHPSSAKTSERISEARHLVLNHFHVTSNQYSVVFTSGATNALKLVAESFPWRADSLFCYLRNSHTSVVGMREVALEKGARAKCIQESEIKIRDSSEPASSQEPTSHTLFAYPAQCNFSGKKYPLTWIDALHEHRLYTKSQGILTNGLVLLDAASFVCTSPLDLSQHQPDFVCLSFYKMFGYPTGLGALLVRNDRCDLLRKTYYGGGTVAATISSEDFHVERTNIAERLEDGTLPFLDIIALKYGFEVLDSLPGGMAAVQAHTTTLLRYVRDELASMSHATTGRPVCVIYGETDYMDELKQGPIVAFNVLDDDGRIVGFSQVERLASLRNIHVRSGCFCNTGACQEYLELTNEDLKRNIAAGHVCGDDVDIINGKPTGCIRVSFGYMSTFEDAYQLIDLLKSSFVKSETRSSSTTTGDVYLRKILVYPIKSCGAYEVNEWEIGDKGLVFDRLWMVVSESGRCLSQKQVPQMCHVRPMIDSTDACMILRCEGKAELGALRVPLHAHGDLAVAEMCTSKVCGDKINGLDCGDEAGRWLSRAVDRSCRLIRLTDRQKEDENSEKLSFANQSQYLLVSMQSVRALASSIDESEESVARRFRPNLIIDGCLEKFTEDQATSVTISSLFFKVHSLCNRCQMICIDQMTGERNGSIFRRLVDARNGKVTFGVYLTCDGFGEDARKVAVGERVFIC